MCAPVLTPVPSFLFPTGVAAVMLRVVCPRCAREILAFPQSAGRAGQCACGASFAVPGAPARRPPSTRAAVLLVAAAIAVGLTGGLWPGKRSAAARQPASASPAEGPGHADLGRAGPPALPALPPSLAAALRPPGGGPKPRPSEPPVVASLSARDLLRLYQGDPAAADARYRGRTIRVRGELAPPPPGGEGGYVAGLVTFGAEEVPPAAYPEPVLSRAGVLLRAAPTRLVDFHPFPSGSSVEVVGRCAGWRRDEPTYLGTVVVLEDCRVTAAPGSARP